MSSAVRPWAPGIIALLQAPLLVGAALGLVTAQYRTRQLVARAELAQQEAAALSAAGARLQADLVRAAQPANLEAVVQRLGMQRMRPDQLVMLAPVAARGAGAGGIGAAPGSQR